jgi:cell division protein FtsI (penicillin-binding protein 3)
MSIGYEVQATPLQILSLYNAVANNGKLLLPQFVSEIKHGGEVVRPFKPVVINEKICSKNTLEQVQKMLEGVVEKGTAKSLSKSIYRVAGKTGTAQMNYSSANKDQMKYRASFVGYFPAEEPKYSCIVVISNPQKNHQYGGEVAAPVFKEIADKVYATFLKDYAGESDTTAETVIAGGIEIKSPSLDVTPGEMPYVIGMCARDAVYLLEKHGLQVALQGYGKVIGQSLPRGSSYTKGQKITLALK